jgi:hypothetical protein
VNAAPDFLLKLAKFYFLKVIVLRYNASCEILAAERTFLSAGP